MSVELPQLWPGGYYWCHPETPVFPWPNNFGSRNWHNRAAEGRHQLGEWAGYQVWSPGEAPDILPSYYILGSKKEFLEGYDLYPDQIWDDWEVTPTTHPAACFPELGVRDTYTNLGDIQIQAFHAYIIDWVYYNDLSAKMIITDYLGVPTRWISNADGSGLYPQFICAVYPERCFIWMAGTNNFQQMALQSLYAQVPLEDFGEYSTTALYESVAREIERQLIAGGWEKSIPQYYVGHSYGAAILALFAAGVGIGTTRELSNLITYGMPRPGDQRLLDQVEHARSIFVETEGDPVPNMPPSGADMAQLAVVMTIGLILHWKEFARPALAELVSNAGTLEWRVGASANWGTLYTLTEIIALGLTAPLYYPHSIEYYSESLNSIGDQRDLPRVNSPAPASRTYMRPSMVDMLIMRHPADAEVIRELFSRVGRRRRRGRFPLPLVPRSTGDELDQADARIERMDD